MNRKLFFRNLFGAAASVMIAPAIKNLLLSEMVTQTAPASIANGCLISDLNLLVPEFYKSMVEKYGAESYTFMLEYLK